MSRAATPREAHPAIPNVQRCWHPIVVTMQVVMRVRRGYDSLPELGKDSPGDRRTSARSRRRNISTHKCRLPDLLSHLDCSSDSLSSLTARSLPPACERCMSRCAEGVQYAVLKKHHLRLEQLMCVLRTLFRLISLFPLGVRSAERKSPYARETLSPHPTCYSSHCSMDEPLILGKHDAEDYYNIMIVDLPVLRATILKITDYAQLLPRVSDRREAQDSIDFATNLYRTFPILPSGQFLAPRLTQNIRKRFVTVLDVRC